MIVYYYEENGKQLGPFTLEEMKSKRIKKTTLVWKDGLQNWVKAEELVEFKAVVVSVPPPLPNNNQLDIKNTFIKIKNNQLEKLKTINKSSKEKFDRTYKKQIGAPIFAILSMIFIGVFIWINDREGLIILKELIILSRLIGIIIVINIAENQNRNSTIWGILSVFFTYASLIIIGLLPKLKLEEDIYDNKVPARVEYLAIGVILLLLTLSIGWLVRDFFSNYSFIEDWYLYVFIIGFILLKIFFAIWTSKIAKYLNRSEVFYGFLGFLNLVFAFILLGTLKAKKFVIKDNMTLFELKNKLSYFKEKKKYDDALLIQKYFVEKNKDDNILVLNLIDLYIKAEKKEKAEQKINELKQLGYESEKFDVLLFNQAKKLYEKNKIEKSVEIFLEFEKKEKYLKDVYFYLGIFAQINREIQVAISYWKKAEEKGNPDAKGKLFIFNNKYKEKYYLTKKEIIEKIMMFSFEPVNIEYISGFDKITNIKNLKFYFNKYGIAVKYVKNSFIAILYSEISEIEYISDKKIIKLSLFDGKTIELGKLEINLYNVICGFSKKIFSYDICKS